MVDDDDMLLATLTTGDFFGEQCLLKGPSQPATASIRSVEYSDLLKLSRQTFTDLGSTYSSTVATSLYRW